MKKYKINVMKWNLEKYNSTPIFYQKLQILLLMENANTHLVSKFKDHLLYDDMTECFKEYYTLIEIYPRLRTIYDYYESSSYLFPNYTAINEGKYIYKNIIKKQKLIDYLEDLEDKKKEKEEKKIKNISKKEESSSFIEVFDPEVYDNIRKETNNDSKIDELFCVENKVNNDCDSLASVVKLTEILNYKEKEKEKNLITKEINNNSKNSYINENKNQNYKNINNIKDKSNKIINNNKNNNSNKNISHKNNNFTNIITNHKNTDINHKNNMIINKDNNNFTFNNKKINHKNNLIYISKDNSKNNKNNNKSNNINDINNQSGIESKILVSRRVSIINNQSCCSKKGINKLENININNFINDSKYDIKNLTSRILIHNSINWQKKIIKDNNRSNDFNKSSQSTISKKVLTSSSNNKNNNKKNNIIINIINNNKNNNYHSSNYYSNYTNNSNDNKNNKYHFYLNNNYYSNYLGNNTNENKYNIYKNISTNFISNNSSKRKNSIRINTNYSKGNKIIKNQISSKGLTVKTSTSNNTKNINKKSKKKIKPKLLAFKLTSDLLPTDGNFAKNLTDRLKTQSQSSSIKKSKVQSKIKNILSPNQNMKKRTKTEILGTKSEVFLFGQPIEITNYHKSINRKILKNINLSNSNKIKKGISLVNKKKINYHFSINNSNNNSNPKIRSIYIKHSSTNSQNLTGIGIINKIGQFQIKEIVRKKIGIFPFTKTERTSRNHSKDKINKITNTTLKKNFKDSFSPKKSQELIYNKITKIKNKNSKGIISSFLKSVSSNKKFKYFKIKKKNNNSTYKSMSINLNNKDVYNRINKDKNF